MTRTVYQIYYCRLQLLGTTVLKAQENRTLYRYSRVGAVTQFIIIAFASKHWHGLRRVDLTTVLQDHPKKTRKTRVTVTIKLTIHKTSTLSKLAH